MKDIAVVGGAGYIGQRLVPYLVGKGHTVTVIDPCILHTPDFGPGVVFHQQGIRTALLDGLSLPDTVIYLASFHDLPFWDKLDHVEKVLWEAQARDLMVDIPVKLANMGKEVIYISSMRALTHPTTFYGNLKAIAERELFQKATIVRLGTVFGGLDTYKYNRTITVPNNLLVRGEFPDDNWQAFITPMVEACRRIGLFSALPHLCEVASVCEGPVKRPAQLLALVGKVLSDEGQRLWKDFPREEHPAYATARFYDLPLPKEAP